MSNDQVTADTFSELQTPSLVLDLERVRRNAVRVARIADRHGVRLRPHVKTHKCSEIAQLQTDGRRAALTTSTLAEVRLMARNGFRDFTYAVPIEPGKFADAVAIARTGVSLNLVTDDASVVVALDTAAKEAKVRFGVFVKIDTGYHRCGVEPKSTEATTIPTLITRAENLDFAGILTHAGHSYHARTIAEIARIAADERDLMVDLAVRLREAGIEVPCVSIGSTPTINHVDHLRGVDEVRPGNYIFFDAFQATLGSCSFDDCALTVLTAVTHRDAVRRKIVVDAGAIALSKDRGPVEFDELCGFGRVLDLAGRELGMRVESLSQEHGVFVVDDPDLFDRFTVGSRLRVLANHSCLTAAQHDHYNLLENGKIVGQWEIGGGW